MDNAHSPQFDGYPNVSENRAQLSAWGKRGQEANSHFSSYDANKKGSWKNPRAFVFGWVVLHRFDHEAILAALGLETLTAINRARTRWLEGDFRRLVAAGAGCREHLARAAGATAAAEAATAATPTTATVATTAAAAATTAVAAAAAAATKATTAATTLCFLGVAAGLAALGLIGEAAFGEALLLVRRESEFRAAVDAYDCFVLIGHTRSPRR
jgi:hypothetical protein